jgi:hypothetical protein
MPLSAPAISSASHLQAVGVMHPSSPCPLRDPPDEVAADPQLANQLVNNAKTLEPKGFRAHEKEASI